MFRFRSRRSQLVSRLAGEAGEAGEEDGRRRRRLTNLLKRLEVAQLESLLAGLETGGGEPGDCWDCEESHHLTELADLRWSDVASEDTETLLFLAPLPVQLTGQLPSDQPELTKGSIITKLYRQDFFRQLYKYHLYHNWVPG